MLIARLSGSLAGLLLAYSMVDLLADGITPIVEIEETVYSYESADNGSGPMWCAGSTCLVRVVDDVFASGLETIEDAKPLNNCRWLLFKRETDGWRRIAADLKGRTREPCPLVGLAGGRLCMSVNPTLVEDPNVRAGPARPEILVFDAADPAKGFQTVLPEWQDSPPFTEHTYRSFAADGRSGEMILFQNIGYTHVEYAFRDAAGRWPALGRLVWPWGAEYDRPQPIRVCYPNVMLKDRAVHFCGVSDIHEPYEEWRAYKKELTGRDWDYDFRRLFYTWTPDVTKTDFREWVEISSRDKTCGRIFPQDLWVGPDGTVHVLWTETATDFRLRDKFFPDIEQTHALNYARLREGEIVHRDRLLLGGEGASSETPTAGRFHVMPNNRLFVFFHVGGTDADGKPISENRVVELLPGHDKSTAVRVPLANPMTSYFTATVRAGSPPSDTLELLGTRAGGRREICYARIRLE